MEDNVDVVVEPHPVNTGRVQATVRDAKRQRAWSGEGSTSSEATTDAVRRFLGDRRVGEYVRKS